MGKGKTFTLSVLTIYRSLNNLRFSYDFDYIVRIEEKSSHSSHMLSNILYYGIMLSHNRMRSIYH